MYKNITAIVRTHPQLFKCVLMMKFISFFVFGLFIQTQANVFAQKINISVSKAELSDVLNIVQKQTDLDFLFNSSELKNVGKIAPKISYRDLVLISARDMEKPEESLLKKNKVKIFSTAELRKRGVERTVIETLKYLDHCDLIYVSFDVDSLDPTASRGTGTPVAQGITEREAGNLMSRLITNQKVCCFEMVEVNPTLDRENQMAEHAFEILIKSTNAFRNE